MQLIKTAEAEYEPITNEEEPQDENEQIEESLKDYYNKPQNDIQFDYLYIMPGAHEAGFNEWTRDSILSNYGSVIQQKIGWCVEEIRILEMMKADAILKNDRELIFGFIDPLIRFSMGEKFSLENTSRNLSGYNAQISRSNFSMIQQLNYNEEKQSQEKKGMFSNFKMPKLGGGKGSMMPTYGWDTL